MEAHLFNGGTDNLFNFIPLPLDISATKFKAAAVQAISHKVHHAPSLSQGDAGKRTFLTLVSIKDIQVGDEKRVNHELTTPEDILGRDKMHLSRRSNQNDIAYTQQQLNHQHLEGGCLFQREPFFLCKLLLHGRVDLGHMAERQAHMG